ncbi:MAG: hypothetical protein R3C03_07050 [Pirellulaceae bacterium]
MNSQADNRGGSVHRIRLAGPWDWKLRLASGETQTARKPMDWVPEQNTQVDSVSRKFNTPTGLASSCSVRLEMNNWPQTAYFKLNHSTIDRSNADMSNLLHANGQNILMVEFDPPLSYWPSHDPPTAKLEICC